MLQAATAGTCREALCLSEGKPFIFLAVDIEFGYKILLNDDQKQSLKNCDT